jgi:hypothetical protein
VAVRKFNKAGLEGVGLGSLLCWDPVTSVDTAQPAG